MEAVIAVGRATVDTPQDAVAGALAVPYVVESTDLASVLEDVASLVAVIDVFHVVKLSSFYLELSFFMFKILQFVQHQKLVGYI